MQSSFLPEHRALVVLTQMRGYPPTCSNTSLRPPNASARLFANLLKMSLRCPKVSARLFAELLKHKFETS